jgi:hypothetical protein
MIRIPGDVQKDFEKIMDQESIPRWLRGFYLKWLRYYFDFCRKYQHEVWDGESLHPFITKLTEKRQPAHLKQQASNAITLFYKKCHNSQAPGKQLKTSDPNNLLRTASSKGSSNTESDTYLKSTVMGGDKVNLTRNIEPPDEDVDSDNRIRNADWTSIFEGLKQETSIRHYSPKTLRAYAGWARQFQTFTKSKPPRLLSSADVKDFLTFLAVDRCVSASSQNQAFNALLFLFRYILKKNFDGFENVPRAKRKPYIPEVLSRKEIDSVLNNLHSPYDLVVKLLYGCGLGLFARQAATSKLFADCLSWLH